VEKNTLTLTSLILGKQKIKRMRKNMNKFWRERMREKINEERGREKMCVW
jgi:hypothetical protein